MKISGTDAARAHGLANAIQRVQANMDRRAARAPDADEASHPGATALEHLQANLARKSGAGEPGPEPLPAEPAPTTDPLIPDPAPAPSPGPGALLDVLA